MLSDKARYRIFGLALETVFETGDFLKIIQDLQRDDPEMAIFFFKIKWAKVKRILIDSGSWATRFEAIELLDTFMNTYRIKNREIWEEVLHTDQDLFLFGKKISLNTIWEERLKADPKQRMEIDRLTIIKALLNTYMLETKIMQDSESLRRLDVIFPQELQIVVDKLKHYQIRCSVEDLQRLLEEEFPRLPQSYFNYVGKYLQQILDGYQAVDFELPSRVSAETDTLEDEFDNVFANALVDEEINHLKTREPEVSLDEGNQSLVINLKGKDYEITVDSITDLLLKMLNFPVEEIYNRVADQIRTFRRHARDEDRLETFWLIIDNVEKQLQAQWTKDDQSELMEKIGKIITCISILKTEMGNDIALLCSLRLAKEAQNKAGT